MHRGGPGSAESAAANAQAEASADSGAGPGRAGGAAAAMGLLNFTREPVPEAVSGDMHNLNQLSAEVRGRPGGERGEAMAPGPARTHGAAAAGMGGTGNGPCSSPGEGPERAPAPPQLVLRVQGVMEGLVSRTAHTGGFWSRRALASLAGAAQLWGARDNASAGGSSRGRVVGSALQLSWLQVQGAEGSSQAFDHSFSFPS